MKNLSKNKIKFLCNYPSFQIIVVIFIAFVISIMVLYFVHDWYRLNYETFYGDFFSNPKIMNENTIFLLGSSHVGTLNATNMQKILLENGENYRVINLQESGDHPVDRIKWIDKIISTNPEIVVYGIDIRNFRSLFSEIKEPQISPFPSVQQIVAETQESINDSEWESIFGNIQYSFENPKLVSLRILDEGIKDYSKSFVITHGESKPGESKPGESKEPLMSQTLSYDELVSLKNNRPEKDLWGFIDINHENISALKIIVKKLQKNGVHVIIFATPAHEFYYEPKSDEDMKNFQLILEDLSNELDVTVYDFHDSYWDLDIWFDLEHISLGSDIYDNDITKIILNELS